jgi:hypothetical protein
LHLPAGRARHEQRSPSTEFSLAAFSQLHCSADCLPQEQVACWAVIVEGMGQREVEDRKWRRMVWERRVTREGGLREEGTMS